MSKIGYFGIVVPTYNLFNGCMLHDGPEIVALADRLIGSASALEGSPEIVEQIANVSASDQRLIGMVTSLVVEGFITNRNEILVPASYALHRLLGEKFFFVRGEIEAQGTRTFVETMPGVADETAARDFVNRHPVVLEVKKRLMDEQVQRAREGKLGKHDA